MLINSVLNVKAVVAAFNQEKALGGAFSVITNLRMELFEALILSVAKISFHDKVEPLHSPWPPAWDRRLYSYLCTANHYLQSVDIQYL